jgi:hypothetical protein
MAGTVIVPWYATGFRGADFETALGEVAATALRYGATSYAVYRARDDRYKFQQLAAFEEKLDWERYWEGQEMTDFRVLHSSWYQVPVLYGWWDLTTSGGLALEATALPIANGHTNGFGNGSPRPIEGESA